MADKNKQNQTDKIKNLEDKVEKLTGEIENLRYTLLNHINFIEDTYARCAVAGDPGAGRSAATPGQRSDSGFAGGAGGNRPDDQQRSGPSPSPRPDPECVAQQSAPFSVRLMQ